MAKDKSKSLLMAQRLKELRTEKGLSHESLRKALMDTYEIDISIDSLKNYEVSKVDHAKAGKNEGMRVEYLRYLADFYGVSSDYLLGLTDIRTPSTDMQAIIAHTGLSEDNVLTLHHMKENSSDGLSVELSDDGSMTIDGCMPYLALLNDILDAVYSQKDIMTKEFAPMQYLSPWSGLPVSEDVCIKADAEVRDFGQTVIPISALIEYKSARIAKEIEKYLIDKYTGKRQ